VTMTAMYACPCVSVCIAFTFRAADYNLGFKYVTMCSAQRRVVSQKKIPRVRKSDARVQACTNACRLDIPLVQKPLAVKNRKSHYDVETALRVHVISVNVPSNRDNNTIITTAAESNRASARATKLLFGKAAPSGLSSLFLSFFF